MKKIFDQIESLELTLQVVKDLLDDSNKEEHNYCMGMAAYELKFFDDAVQLLQDSFRSSPSAETAIRLAMSNLSLDSYLESEKWVDKALEIDDAGSFKALVLGSEHAYLSVKARIKYETGFLELAMRLAEAALTIVPNDIMSLTIMGKISLHLNNPEAALPFFRKAKDVAPNCLKNDVQHNIDIAENFEQANKSLSAFSLDRVLMSHREMLV